MVTTSANSIFNRLSNEVPTEGDFSTGSNEMVTFGELPSSTVSRKLYFLPRVGCELALTVSSQLSKVESGRV